MLRRKVIDVDVSKTFKNDSINKFYTLLFGVHLINIYHTSIVSLLLTLS